MSKLKAENLKPFLRWVGGKNWLVKHLDTLLPSGGFKNYHEPFLGGGSIFFSINPANISFLSDLNKDLLSTFAMLKSDPESIIKILKNYKNNEEFYYKIRHKQMDDLFNIDARFIYLNKT